MGVYIKGMEMPKECFECIFYENDICQRTGAEMCYEAGIGGRNDDCPLVSVPNHGDLIDRDALRDAMYHEAFETDSEWQKWDSGCWIRYKMFERNCDLATVVIPEGFQGRSISDNFTGRGGWVD